MRVLAADVVDVGILVETAHRVAAQQRKGARARQLIPEHLELDSRVLLPVAPQDVDHLAEDPHLAVGSIPTDVFDGGAHRVVKSGGVRLAVGHEDRQRVPRVEKEEPPRALQFDDIECACAEFEEQRRAEAGRRGDDGGMVVGESLTEELRRDLDERSLAFIKPHRMIPAAGRRVPRDVFHRFH
jgi:hypothetical protein